MQTILICLLIAMLLPYAAKVPLAMAMAKLGRYDNDHPRAQQAQLTGFGARALAGYQNAFESLIVFGIAVLTALITNNVTDVVALLAIVPVVRTAGLPCAVFIEFWNITFIILVCGHRCIDRDILPSVLSLFYSNNIFSYKKTR